MSKVWLDTKKLIDNLVNFEKSGFIKLNLCKRCSCRNSVDFLYNYSDVFTGT